jgi:glycosyltransferase involved in cell wall biosynthesis
LSGTIDSAADGAAPACPEAVIVAARDEAEEIGRTLAALAAAFPGAALWVADDGSRDATAEIARASGARVTGGPRPVGKGGAMTLAATQALVSGEDPAGSGVFLLCDGDLAESAARLGPLCEAVADGRADIAVASFQRSVGGGFGLALGFAAWAIRRRCGLSTRAPISGQRALSRATMERVLPLARGYGMEIGMTIDAVRAGGRLLEVELDLSHRATGRTAAGFLHRGRQLADFVLVYLARR